MDGFEVLKGVWNIVPTPFLENGDIDEASIGTLVDLVGASGVDGITILGVMGESAKLSDAERRVVIGATLASVAGRFPVCVGVTHAATVRAVAFAREAQELGAHSVMLAPPIQQRADDAELRRHYFTVADAIDLPIVVQDHPASSGVFMSAEFLASLADGCARCRVIKLEDEPSPPKIRRLLAANPNVVVLGGLGGIMLLEELRAGAAGTMTGFGYPELLVDIVGRFRSGDEAGAEDAFYRACPLIRFENQPVLNLSIRKLIYQRRGAIASARARAPSATVDAGTIADLEDLLTRLNLPAASRV